MNTPATFDFDVARKSAAQFNNVATRMNEEYPLSVKFPSLHVSGWQRYQVPGMYGCSFDGISGRLMFTINSQDKESGDDAVQKLARVKHLHRFPGRRGTYFTTLCCPLDLGGEEQMYDWLKENVLEPLKAA